jgi:MOSC domain-containing protein YiiM
MTVRVVSVNVGKPRVIDRSRGKATHSAIFKKPVQGPVKVRRLNLEGDQQADLTVHGGVDKAVYAYPSEHYEYWREKFPRMEMPWGTFGENLTTQGLHEQEIHIGDRLAVGSAEFAVTKPRLPCYKLGIKFGTQTMLRLFLESERTGFYLKVLKEGQIEKGNEIKVLRPTSESESITDVVRRVKSTESISQS